MSSPDHSLTTMKLDGQEPPAALTFRSILAGGSTPEFSHETDGLKPSCFVDLNLDQIVDGITAARAEYDLKPIFCTPLSDEASVRYRQDVAKDIDGT